MPSCCGTIADPVVGLGEEFCSSFIVFDCVGQIVSFEADADSTTRAALFDTGLDPGARDGNVAFSSSRARSCVKQEGCAREIDAG
jgi:hypothetical protein